MNPQNDVSPPWTVEEEVALLKSNHEAKHFIDRLSITHPSQFWEQLVPLFHSILGREQYRSGEQLSSKFIDLRGKIARFDTIYKTVYNNRQMVWNETDIMTKAQEEHRSTIGTPFNHVEAWRFVCEHSD
jgi:hypothetical protein